MSDIKEFPTAETQTSVNRKRTGRPKSKDPKISITLSLRQSTVERIANALPNGHTVAGALSAAVENKYGTREPQQVTPRPKGSTSAS